MSQLARLSLANRAVVALTTVAVFLLGLVSLGSLKQELIPSLQIPQAAVVAVYPGAAPDVVADQVSEPLEEAVRGVEGVEAVRSTSSTSMSVTTVELTYGTDMDAAAAQLRGAVDDARRSLPQDVDPQVVTGSVDDLPVVQLAVSRTEGGADGAALAAFVQDTVVPRLQEVADVRSVSVSGVAEQQVVIDPDHAALAGAGLSVTDLGSLLEDNGVVLPAGTVTDGDKELSVQVGAPLASVDELRALPLVSPAAAPGSAPVTLGDVAEVTAGPADPTSYSRLDGEPSLGVAITKTPQGNTVEVSHAVADALDELQPALDAAGVRTAVVFDQAPFIEESIHGLATEGGLGLIFAVVVILLFLASIPSTLVSAISIPLSLAVTFVVMNLTGYTLNILTLGAMTIAIGRVVDDSIVVIENIKRHQSYGEDKRSAILTAVREVGGAITSSTVCTVAVFAPIGFVTGMVGELFRPFAMTIAIAMLSSLVVALMVVPVLAYWFLRSPQVASAEDGAALREAAEAKERRGLWQRAYVPSLAASLRRPWAVVGVAVVVLAGTGVLVPRMETSFIGDSGQNTLNVTQTFEAGTALETQDAGARDVEDVLAGVPGVETVQSTVGNGGDPMAAMFGGGGANRATFAVTLGGDVDGEETRAAVRDALAAAGVPGDIEVSGGDSGFGSSTVDLVVTAPDGDALAAAAEQVADAARDVDGVAEVTSNLAAAQETVRVTVDRAAAAAAGLTETQVNGIVVGTATDRTLGQVDLGDGPVDVVVAADAAPQTVADLEQVALPGPAGPVPLVQVATVEVVDSPASVTRADGRRSATVAVTPAGQDLGSLTTALTTAVDGLELPAGADVTVGGVAADQAEAFADLGLALLAAIAIVYVVMVGTFRSLVQPLILMVSVPFAATGALLALLVTGTPLGVPALIGVLMLVGIVVSNAIVLIDLINQYRERGRTLDDAVAEGARKRLRPIVMTAAATIFALTPMALGVTGGGSFISRPLALVVIGGLLSSTLLTLYVVPAIYVLVERSKERRGARRRPAPVVDGEAAGAPAGA
ncbi:AcrB/AcrD/AcrF family protein [Xylanimonas oleitrophica]|uniref:AcrB/AcrD/AcrF family protein n=1 Tax=Xylanimonas oleitrophica TaxID=2607479 RepID=A0A2W5X261_9MICO|nr:efflux RND transporter permease subunit [Xylanimonas oleitrophica]PZR54415.1 AcrB/AcrD/AcrF family protein [Xylanimonas oleitrophica]